MVQRGERAADPVPSNRFEGTALRDYGAAELDAALAHLGWRGGRLHEGVHQARKSLRRARAVLALECLRSDPAPNCSDASSAD